MAKQYIVSGSVFHGHPDASKNGLFDESLDLVSNRFFSMEGIKKKWILVATDSLGILHSVDADVNLKIHPIQRFHAQELLLNLVPQGAVTYSYFEKTESWQKKLNKQINSRAKQDGTFFI